MVRTSLVQDVGRSLVQELDLTHLRGYVKLQIWGHRREENVRIVQVESGGMNIRVALKGNQVDGTQVQRTE
jgi:hypothetical protein